MLSLKDRVELYNNSFPDYPCIWFDKGWILGVWNCGNDYRNKTSYYGTFPAGYLKRLMSLWPDKRNILHVFSGALPPGDYTRVDINASLSPDIVCNAENLGESIKDKFDLIILDPPYDKSDAEKYGFKLPNKHKVIRECFKVATPNAHMCFLDTRLPMYNKSEWKRVGEIMLTRSTNHRVRGTFIFERQ